jgi:hypothetical protein
VIGEKIMELHKLAEILNAEFSPPFLREGEVRAKMQGDGTLKIFIGRRDIHISAEGKVIGAGTCALPAWSGSD